jgi:hypothetical protein
MIAMQVAGVAEQISGPISYSEYYEQVLASVVVDGHPGGCGRVRSGGERTAVQVQLAARALLGCGVRADDAALIMGRGSPEWYGPCGTHSRLRAGR